MDEYKIDEVLLFKYPGLDNVAGFLGSAGKTHYRCFGSYKPFDDLGIKTEEEFVKLIEWGNEGAVGLYRRIKEVLCF